MTTRDGHLQQDLLPQHLASPEYFHFVEVGQPSPTWMTPLNTRQHLLLRALVTPTPLRTVALERQLRLLELRSELDALRSYLQHADPNALQRAASTLAEVDESDEESKESLLSTRPDVATAIDAEVDEIELSVSQQTADGFECLCVIARVRASLKVRSAEDQAKPSSHWICSIAGVGSDELVELSSEFRRADEERWLLAQSEPLLWGLARLNEFEDEAFWSELLQRHIPGRLVALRTGVPLSLAGVLPGVPRRMKLSRQVASTAHGVGLSNRASVPSSGDIHLLSSVQGHDDALWSGVLVAAGDEQPLRVYNEEGSSRRISVYGSAGRLTIQFETDEAQDVNAHFEVTIGEKAWPILCEANNGGGLGRIDGIPAGSLIDALRQGVARISIRRL